VRHRETDNEGDDNSGYDFVDRIWNSSSGDSMKLQILIVLALSFTFGNVTKYDLKTDYLNYNTDYFYGALPANTSVIWGDLSQYDDMGRIDERGNGSMLITIDPRYHMTLKQADMSLLHEMCHEKTGLRINISVGLTQEEEGFDGHGPVFQNCMIDLAKKGAFKDLW